jgi:hypothetical protein
MDSLWWPERCWMQQMLRWQPMCTPTLWWTFQGYNTSVDPLYS